MQLLRNRWPKNKLLSLSSLSDEVATGAATNNSENIPEFSETINTVITGSDGEDESILAEDLVIMTLIAMKNLLPVEMILIVMTNAIYE